MAEDNNIRVINSDDKDFPQKLLNIKQVPESLYCIGNTDLLQMTAVAVVGARKCSEYGRQVALKIGKLLAQNGLVTVSGMADGIDGYAHQGALMAGGKTIAVLGSGVDVCYPHVNRSLYKKICSEGLVVSEFKPGTEPLPYRFPMRNRIISGLAEVVVVVEAKSGSGSLITAVYAAEQGRDVIAVPGNISSPMSLGCNKLIADGAAIMTSPDDILRMINIEPKLINDEILNLGNDERMVFEFIRQKGEVSMDYLCANLNKDTSFMTGLVTTMEMKGLLSYHLGKIFIAKI